MCNRVPPVISAQHDTRAARRRRASGQLGAASPTVGARCGAGGGGDCPGGGGLCYEQWGCRAPDGSVPVGRRGGERGCVRRPGREEVSGCLALLWTRLTSARTRTEAKRLTYLHDPAAKNGIINDLSRVIEAAPDEKADDPTRKPQLLISGEEAESQAKPLRPGGLGVWLNRGNTPDHNVWSLNYMDERTNAHYGQAANTHHDWYQPGVIAPDKDVPHSMYYNVLEHWTGHDPMAPPYEATRPPPPPPIPPAPAAAAGSGAGSGSGAEGGCPADFPFQDNNVPLCWKTSDLQAAGTGPCGTWCTKDVAAGGGCGDNADHLCS